MALNGDYFHLFMELIMLKHCLSFLTIFTLGMTAHAAYVQGNVGLSTYDVGGVGNALNDLDKQGNAAFRVAIGNTSAAHPTVRYTLDYTHFGTLEETIGSTTAEFATQGLGVSVASDLAHYDKFTPYGGLRLGLNSLEFSAENGTERVKTDKKTAGVGATVGVQYALNPQIALDVNAEYNHLGKIDGVKIVQYGVNTGVRFHF